LNNFGGLTSAVGRGIINNFGKGQKKLKKEGANFGRAHRFRYWSNCSCQI